MAKCHMQSNQWKCPHRKEAFLICDKVTDPNLLFICLAVHLVFCFAYVYNFFKY